MEISKEITYTHKFTKKKAHLEYISSDNASVVVKPEGEVAKPLFMEDFKRVYEIEVPPVISDGEEITLFRYTYKTSANGHTIQTYWSDAQWEDMAFSKSRIYIAKETKVIAVDNKGPKNA